MGSTYHTPCAHTIHTHVCMGIVYMNSENVMKLGIIGGDIEPKSIFLFASVIDVC